MSGPIINANTRPIAQGSQLPNMSSTLSGWMRPITLGFVEQVNNSGSIKEIVRELQTNGVYQPLRPQLLQTKPEGQRHWEWQMLHCQPGLPIRPGSIVVLEGNKFRVMAKNDYSAYGYIEYHLVEDYVQDVWRGAP